MSCVSFLCVSALAETSEAYFSALSKIGEKAFYTMSSRSLGTCTRTHTYMHLMFNKWEDKDFMYNPGREHLLN